MTKFEKKSVLKKMKMNIDELSNYYKELRKYNYEQGIPLKNIQTRRIIHEIPLSILKLDRVLSGEKVKIISDERIDTSAPKIYACTHIGGKDIERVFEAIEEHCYLFLGDPGEIYKSPVGMLLNLNGMIPLETRDKQDRKIAKERAVELLKKGGNLLIFPEGAWNITENLPVMKLFPGTVSMAIESGAEIIPVAIEQENNTFYVSFGKNIKYINKNLEERHELTSDLRDNLVTLMWDLWTEINNKMIRKELPEDFKENYVSSIINKCDYGYTAQDVIETRYHDKTITTPEEAFSFKKKLIPSKKNAFLLKKLK